MNWGKWIVAAFVFFALFIATLVVVCVRQDIPLVSKEYYNEELRYQEQIERIGNASALTEKPALAVKDGELSLSYSELSKVSKGELKLFRPSDALLDQSFSIRGTTEVEQRFKLNNPVPGLYRARFTWEQQGKAYYIEKIIII